MSANQVFHQKSFKAMSLSPQMFDAGSVASPVDSTTSVELIPPDNTKSILISNCNNGIVSFENGDGPMDGTFKITTNEPVLISLQDITKVTITTGSATTYFIFYIAV